MGPAPRGAAAARTAMQVVMAASFIWWLLFWVLQPDPTTKAWLRTIDAAVNSRFQGSRGSLFLLQILPIMVIAFLSYFVLELRRRLSVPSAKEMTDGRKPRIDIWSLPVVLRGPFFGMLTLGDIIAVGVILFVVSWYFIRYTILSAQQTEKEPGVSWSMELLYEAGERLGIASLIPIALLWIPVSRGSAILQVIGVPFERAVRYHTWLGYLAVWIVVFHGAFTTGYFIYDHDLKELITWETRGTRISIAAGVVAGAAGVIMTVTALDRVRRKYFNLFFAAHHLYLVFLLFFAFHCVSFVMYIIIPVLIFFMDRFIRAVQSRKPVDVLSAVVYKSGIIELKVAKAPNTTYNALSFLYVKLPSVSWLHWHPFSVASSPLDGTNSIAIFIKPLGDFTKNLHDVLISSSVAQPGRDFYKCPFASQIGLEGPYGDESDFYLKYKKLVLVAGGIGVTPFLAIIRDILHRHRLRQENLPSSINLVFCVRNAAELHILDAIAPSSILPDYRDHLTISVEAYVTSKSASAEDASSANLPSSRKNQGEVVSYMNAMHDPTVAVSFTASGPPSGQMSRISSTGDARWVAAIFAATVLGFILINGMFNVTVLKTDPRTNYVRVFLLTTATAIAVVICGGGVMLLWAFLERRPSEHDRARITSQLSMSPPPSLSKNKDIETSVPEDEQWQLNATYGRRPNWKEYFANLALTHEGQSIGVLVSGASQMQEDVASECRRHSLSRASTVVMHYHSVSFEL